MIISYGRPSSISVAISGGDASIDTDEDALFDGRPGSVTRCTWPSGAQTTATVVHLDLSWIVGQKPRLIGILGLKGLPAGTLLKVQHPDGGGGWQDPPGGNFSQRVVRLASGELAAWMLLDAPAGDITDLRISAYNDVDGSASISASAEFDIGEIWLGPLVEIPLQRGWRVAPRDLSTVNYSISGQPWPVKRARFRELQGRLDQLASEADVRYQALAGGMDWERLLEALSGAEAGVCVPRWRTDGVLDADVLHAHAMFGHVPPDSGVIEHTAGSKFTGEWRWRERRA